MPKKKKDYNRVKTKVQNAAKNSLSNRSSVRKLWTEAQMSGALKSVLDDGVSRNKAAMMHGVPCSTLKDRLSGRVIHGRKPGPKPYLNVDEEQELADHLITASNIGYGKTRQDVFSIVEKYVNQKDDVSL